MRSVAGLALTFALVACGDEAEVPAEGAPVEQGGEVEGDVLGGSISDDMIALEQLTSQSPSLRRQTTTVTTTQDGEGGSETTVETTTTVTSGESPAPAAPEPPTPPRG